MCSRGDLQSCGEEVEEEEGASFIHSFLRRGSDLHSFCGKTTLQGAMSAVRLPPLALSVPAQICNVATNRPMRRAAENGMYVCVCVCMYGGLFRAVDLEAKL